mmetsp:Transcript_7398/g.23654  ORF Transcript_7398/g.23654 Transcript_7398/m.23654 type:complete len:207 (-) Transcript_7398:423-1043(-)
MEGIACPESSCAGKGPAASTTGPSHENSTLTHTRRSRLLRTRHTSRSTTMERLPLLKRTRPWASRTRPRASRTLSTCSTSWPPKTSRLAASTPRRLWRCPPGWRSTCHCSRPRMVPRPRRKRTTFNNSYTSGTLRTARPVLASSSDTTQVRETCSAHLILRSSSSTHPPSRPRTCGTRNLISRFGKILWWIRRKLTPLPPRLCKRS